MRRTTIQLLCKVLPGLLLVASACGGESKPQSEATAAAPAGEASATPTPADPAPKAPAWKPPEGEADREPRPEEMPVQEDFEGRAERDITRETYKLELDAIEAELAEDAAEEEAKRAGVK